MILSIKTQIKINAKNFKHYQELHYYPIIGEVMDVFVKDLTKCSSALIKIECDVCHCIKTIKYENYYNNIKKYGYYSCNGKCSKSKLKKTCNELYGNEFFFKCDAFKKKSKETCNLKYGVDNYIESDVFKEKSKQTKRIKYNDENFNNRSKAKNTCMEIYGVEHTSKRDTFNEKTKHTLLERYGDENYNNRDKAEKTNMKRYGVKHSSQHCTVKNKQKTTNIKKYGFSCALQNEIVKNKTLETNVKKYGINHPMQNQDVFQKQQKSSYGIKKHPETGLYYRGTYEKDFLDLCFNKNIPIRQGKTIKYLFDGKLRTYFSDFYLEYKKLIVEIKSTYTYKKDLEKNLAKQKACLEQGFNFIFIINKDYVEFLNIIKIFPNFN